MKDDREEEREEGGVGRRCVFCSPRRLLAAGEQFPLLLAASPVTGDPRWLLVG